MLLNYKNFFFIDLASKNENKKFTIFIKNNLTTFWTVNDVDKVKKKF